MTHNKSRKLGEEKQAYPHMKKCTKVQLCITDWSHMSSTSHDEKLNLTAFIDK